MSKVPFNEKELEVVGKFALRHGSEINKYNTPVTQKENLLRALRKEEPLWTPISDSIQTFRPRIMPDNVVCGLVTDGEPPMSVSDYSGKGWFGTEWLYVEKVGGATVKPGAPQITDINKWEEVLVFPDIESYDWEASAKANEDWFSRDRAVEVVMLCGIFERLMSLMDVSNAAIALIDDDQKPAVHALFSRLCDFYDTVIEKYHKYYKPDIVLMHDDWGHQRSSFFSVDTHEEMILPYITRIVESCHKRGMFYEQHSCGKIETMVPHMIKAGIDIWQGQDMNDKAELVNKYGDDILISVGPGRAMQQMPEEDQLRIAEEVFEKMKGKRYIAGIIGTEKTNQRFYKLSRMSYS